MNENGLIYRKAMEEIIHEYLIPEDIFLAIEENFYDDNEKMINSITDVAGHLEVSITQIKDSDAEKRLLFYLKKQLNVLNTELISEIRAYIKKYYITEIP